MARLAANLPPQPGVRGRGVCLLRRGSATSRSQIGYHPAQWRRGNVNGCVNEEKAV